MNLTFYLLASNMCNIFHSNLELNKYNIPVKKNKKISLYQQKVVKCRTTLLFS